MNNIFNKKFSKTRKCYLYDGVLYNYQAIEVIVIKSYLNFKSAMRILNSGRTIRIENKPVQVINVKYK